MGTKVAAHGLDAGYEDYLGRREDVSHGYEDESWAWPFSGADVAYINAVGCDAICKAIGVPEESWAEIASEWCEAFRRGYEAAEAISGAREAGK